MSVTQSTNAWGDGYLTYPGKIIIHFMPVSENLIHPTYIYTTMYPQKLKIKKLNEQINKTFSPEQSQREWNWQRKTMPT